MVCARAPSPLHGERAGARLAVRAVHRAGAAAASAADEERLRSPAPADAQDVARGQLRRVAVDVDSGELGFGFWVVKRHLFIGCTQSMRETVGAHEHVVLIV